MEEIEKNEEEGHKGYLQAIYLDSLEKYSKTITLFILFIFRSISINLNLNFDLGMDSFRNFDSESFCSLIESILRIRMNEQDDRNQNLLSEFFRLYSSHKNFKNIGKIQQMLSHLVFAFKLVVYDRVCKFPTRK